MISDNIEKVACPKCAAEDVKRFEKDIYIIRNNNDFLRRKLYGCNKCEALFTYDDTPRKESKNINNIQNAFAKIAKQCENVTSGISIKSKL